MSLYLLKAHVRDYDRVSKTGAIEHIRAHEDSRVRSYGRKIAASKDSYDLHQLRKDRFGHLPHWNKLNEHTRQAILDAEDEKAKSHKSFEEWKEKAHGKKKPDAVKVDRSGWEQQVMFKGKPNIMYLLRKSHKTSKGQKRSVAHPAALIKSSHDVSNESRGKDGKWAKTGEPNMIHPSASSNIGKGYEVANMLNPVEAHDLYDSDKVTLAEAKNIASEYYKHQLEPNPIPCPAFNGAQVVFRESGFQHVFGEHYDRISDRKIKNRLKLLPKAKTVLETTPFVDEVRDRELDGAKEYGLLGRFTDGSVVRVVVEEVTVGSKSFLSVFGLEDVSKKIKRESRSISLQNASVAGVETAPPYASIQDNITKSTVLRKSKNDIAYNYLKPPRYNDLYLLKSRKLDGRIDFNGLPISIETGKSRIRAWSDPHNGTSGMTLMKHPYGYIRGIDGTDGDELDVYVGPDRQAANVYIVNQMKAPDFTDHDEQKCMLGFPTEEAAREAYLKHYDDPRFLGSIIAMPFDEFKAKVLSGKYDGKMVKSKPKCTREQAKQIGDKLNVAWDKISLDEFKEGLCHEHEHDDVTQGDPIKTGKIALTHLEEDNRYYSKLKGYGLE